MKILIAEDTAIARRFLEVQLTRLGHEVVSTADGTAALDVLSREGAPQVALLDWEMPGMDGPDVCRRLRERRGARYTYVVLVTVRNSRTDAIAGIEAGADDFLAKPVDVDELRVRLRTAERIIALENELQQSRAYLEAVIANVESGALLTDATGRVVFANAVLRQLPGAPEEDPRGKLRVDWMESWGLDEAHGLSRPPPRGDVDLIAKTSSPRVLRRTSRQVLLTDGSGHLELFRDVTDERAREQDLTKLASTDHATGLLNRRGGEMAMRRALTKARGDHTELSFAMFDIDHFKRINDRCGHATGDRVIVAVSTIIKSVTRKDDLAIRWGGEELLVVLPTASIDVARGVADRIRELVEAHRMDGVPPVTISAGIGTFEAADSSLQAAIERADARLYEAKAGGRNQVR